MMLVASLAIKTTLVTAAAFVATRIARRSRASVRHVLFAATFGALLLIPMASLVLPALTVAIPVRTPAAPAPAFQDVAEVAPVAQRSMPTSVRADANVGHGGAPAMSPFVVVWLGGILVCLAPIAAGLLQIRAIRRYGIPWREAESMTNGVASDLGIARRIDVLSDDVLTGPVTCGVLRPWIIFPPDARRWSDDDVRRAITHEMEHVRRHDWLTLCIARAICAVYWFNPLVWMALRRLRLEAERACDDAVLRQSEPVGYADQLVTLAQRLSRGTGRPLLAMANRGDLSTRVSAVLDAGQRRGPASTFAVIASATVAGVLVALLGPLHTVAVAQQPTPAGRRFDVVSVKPCPDDANAGMRGGMTKFSPRRMTIACQNVMGFIERAYVMFAHGTNVGPAIFLTTPIEGAPNWIHTAYYAIEAEAVSDATPGMMQGPMLQALLEDRFKLKIRREIREMPIYALTVAKGGPKLPAFQEGSCVRWAPESREAALAPPQPPPAGQRYCRPDPTGGPLSPEAQLKAMRSNPNMVIDREGITLDEFLESLSGNAVFGLDRRAIDRTGLSGKFIVHLEFAPPPPDPSRPFSFEARSAAGEPTAPSIFTAIQEQLGLKLESTKGPGDAVVIERVERPTEN